jgi:FtsZ-binding cell division protein ZapB
MSRFQSLGRWLSTSDAALSWAERIARWIALGVGSGVGTGILGTIIGAVAGNPLYGLVIGVVVGMLLLVLFAIRAIQIAAAGAPSVELPGAGNYPTMERLQSENEQLKAENEQLRVEVERLRGRPDDEELKRRALTLPEELFRFAQERDGEDPQNRPGWTPGNALSTNPESRERAQEQMRHDDETWTQYRQRYEGDLRALLDDLGRRGWLDRKERDEIEGEFYAVWRSPTDRIKRAAPRIAAIGKRL